MKIFASEITDQRIFNRRRNLLKVLLTTAVAGSKMGAASVSPLTNLIWNDLPSNRSLPNTPAPTPARLVKNYTNYYEFTIDKEASTQLAQKLQTDPWTVEVSGEVENTIHYDIDELLKSQPLKEFVYRHRCVEGWSMVVPWVGFQLKDLLTRVKPLSTAKFVKFTSVFQPDVMPSQRRNIMLEWPYVEGLRIDEAVHPLAIMAVGMYGQPLPNQNGAPLRLVIPWKYGFKSIKSIVKIELVKTAPLTSWYKAAPDEYGFYANVNPAVPHPRWSQASERPLGSRFFSARRPTELFNGYGELVAPLYSGMDLRHFY